MAAEKQQPLRVLGLRGTNFKRLQAVALTGLDPHAVYVTGKNGNGKTSLIDVVFETLTSGKHKLSQADPVRKGAQSAQTEVDLCDAEGIPRFTVKKTYSTRGPSTLEIREYQPDGQLSAPRRSPQSLLDSFLSTISLDPMLFAGMDGRSRADVMLQILGIGDQLQELNDKRQQAYDSRREANAEVKRITGKFSVLTPPPDDLPEQKVDVSDLQARRREAEAQQRAIDDKQRELDQKRSEYRPLRDAQQQDREELERIKQRMEEREQKMLQIQAQAEALTAEIKALPRPEETAQIDEQISKASEINDAIKGAADYEAARQELRDANKQASKYEREIEAIDEQKQELISSAEYPISGLLYDPEDGVTFGGIPFDQLASSERIRISLYIAMALQPTLRVLRITDASLLDSDSRAEVERIAAKHGFQVFFEMVDSSGQVGIVIEDGMIKELPAADPDPEQ